MLRIFRAILLVFTLMAGGLSVAFAQEAPSQENADPRASTGGAQTLEDIMARQRGESVAPLVIPDTSENRNGVAGSSGQLEVLGTQSDADFWRYFKNDGIGTPSSSTAADQVMQPNGQNWRLIRENYIRKYAGWFPLGVMVILLVYHLIRGGMPIAGGKSGKTVPRFTLVQRVSHWFMAAVFMILGLSGLIILLGRPLILPIFGGEVNSIMTSAAMQGHNLFGPMFVLALIWMFIGFVRWNFFQIVDFKWIFKLGGMFGGHVSSDQFNFGEKSWFWIVVLVGGLMGATGLALEFPWLVANLQLLQISVVLHAVGAIVLISVAIGHIYIGTVGMEGSIDSMLKGEVDENWAKEHHDIWYERVTGKSASDAPLAAAPKEGDEK